MTMQSGSRVRPDPGWLVAVLCYGGDGQVLIESIYAAPEKMVVNQFGFGKLVPNPLDMSNPQVGS